MALLGSLRFSDGASLAAAILLCVAASFSWSAYEAAAIQATADSPHIEHAPNGHLPGASYPAGPAEEAEDGARGPVNAGPMTELLLAFSFGVSAGWLLATGRGQEAFRPSGIASRTSFVAGEDPPFLGVFRL